MFFSWNMVYIKPIWSERKMPTCLKSWGSEVRKCQYQRLFSGRWKRHFHQNSKYLNLSFTKIQKLIDELDFFPKLCDYSSNVNQVFLFLFYVGSDILFFFFRKTKVTEKGANCCILKRWLLKLHSVFGNVPELHLIYRFKTLLVSVTRI